jgi:hypothetical protein
MTCRVEMAVFLAVVAFTYLSISRPVVDGNPASRIGLTFSIVERGELNIDRLVAAGTTEDWGRYGGHFYSNKAPGPALLAVPLYFLQNRIQRAVGVADDDGRARWVATYVANFATTIAPTLLALPLLLTVLVRRMRLSPGCAFALCGAWAVGSMAFPYSVMFFGHQSAGAFFAIGMCLTVLELESEGDPRPRVIALAGLAMGLAVISDFLAGALVGVWTVYLAWRTRLAPRLLVAWAVGGVGPLAVVMAYNAACFGSPFTTAYNLSILNPRFVPIAGWEWPSLDRLLDITVRPWRGMFYATPVFALIIVGLARLRGDARGRPEVIGAAAGVVLYFGLLAAFPSSFGGYCIGPRYFTAALPLALLLVAGGARTTPRLFGALLLASTLLMFVATLTEPLPDERFKDPFREVLFPMLAHDGPNPMRNLFTYLVRFSLVGALLTYLAIWAGLAGWLRLRLRRRDARPTLVV